MAIMGIPQALKMIEGPIDALARLPQQELMAMAQRSPSMLKILPVVLNEKAEAAQRAANMAALAQGTPPSVTEQNVAINAQAESQPMMQQPMMAAAPQPMPPMDAGLASLPVEESEFAGGGIVAFDKGGEAKGDVTPEVEKLYSENLGRASDVGGLQYWVDKFGKDNRVTADERAEFINAAAPEVQRRLAAGDTTLPDYMKVDPSVRYALQSKDVTTEDFKKLANYFGNQWIGGEAEDPASLTRRDYIERPRSGYDFATFLASRSPQHGAASDTKQRFASLLAPYMNAELSGEAEKRYIGGEGNEFGFVVTNPMTGEREMAYPSGPLGPTKEGIYRTNVGKHHSTIGDPDRTRYAVGLDYLVDPETGRARLVEPYLEGYQERRRNNTFPITALTTLAGMSMFPNFDAVDAIKRGIVSLGGQAAAQNMAGGGIVAFSNGGLGSTFDGFDMGADSGVSAKGVPYEEFVKDMSLPELQEYYRSGRVPERLRNKFPTGLGSRGAPLLGTDMPADTSQRVAPPAPAPREKPAAIAPLVVPSPEAGAPAPKDMGVSPRTGPTLSSVLQELQSLMPKGEAYSETEKLVRKGMGEREQNIKNAGWLRLAEAGFGMAAGSSPYALVNVAKGGAEALKGYADDLKEQRKLDRDDRKILSDIEQARRLEKRGDITAAVASYEKALDRMSAEDRTRMTISAYRQPASEVQLYQLWASQQPPGADKSLAKFKREMSESVAEGKDPMFDILKRNLAGGKGQVRLSADDANLLRKYLPQ